MDLLKPLRSRFPISQPAIVKLPEEELSWPRVKTSLVRIPIVAIPKLSKDYAFAYTSVDEVAVLTAPSVIDVDTNHLEASFQIVDLLVPLARPGVNGTIFVKKEEELTHRGQRQTKTRVEPRGLRERLDPKQPKGLDIFEMLLPILMPPAATEFGDELLFPHELYPFQRHGVKWLFEKDAALLADDMGLGKTVQAITAFRALVRRGKASQALVICPKSVLTNWIKELERWAPELLAVRVHGPQQTRRLAWRAYAGKCHVLVSTYDIVRQDHDAIPGRVFDLVVADEVQRIKNPDTDTARAVRGLAARRRWGLTGTPLENRLEDMVAILDFIKPGLFQRSAAQVFSSDAVRKRVRPYVLRRRKEEALPELPEKVVDTKFLELTEPQRRTYDLAEREGIVRLRGTQNVTVQHVLALIQQLKQICNFDPQTGESAKVEFLHEGFLEEACQDDDKALIFSQYVKTLEELERHLKDYKPLVYTGRLSTAQRSNIEEAFRSQDEHKILLLSLKAGGLGLNLTRANYVLHFDRWWNPAVESQAEDRTHRIGQLRKVFVTRLICENTIEERIEQLLDRKKILFQEVVDELADVNLERVLSEEELFGLFDLTPPRRARESPRQPALAPVAQPSTADQQAVTVVTPETPYSNVLGLRQMLRRCERYVWWADRYFNSRGLEELFYTIDPAVVREIRILSGPDRIDDRTKGEFGRFRDELERKGVLAEWRVLKGFAHDRFILSDSLCFLVPSIDTIMRGQYSQIVETPHPPPFDDWWKLATPIKDYKP